MMGETIDYYTLLGCFSPLGESACDDATESRLILIIHY